ncbi:hypothetical protein Gocc_2910 [Gaiella occulta]|uniref:Uncharacterized protein n=1 Tax=Gaiella occulta TaxID=1002870 RepID=A0A7M2YU95_9ACTN|nr:hypothetical protein [Gaiella occulta]RDI73310.1 hypothetical protein Gocc_2910 [Gaiella occulta]
MASKVSALLLDASVAAGVEAVTFAGFPGRFVPGEPVEVKRLAAAAGVDAEALLALIEELELPVDVVQVKAGSGPLPVADNHMGGGETFELPPAEEGDAPADDEAAVAEEGAGS